MNWKKEFLWSFSGLKIGFHYLELPLAKEFFEELKHFEVLSGEGAADATLEKKETMLLLQLSIRSKVLVACDRCNEELTIPVEGNMELVYKFGNEESHDESLIVLPQDTYQIDLFQPIYELMVISFPSRFVHNEEECNPEIIKLLNQGEADDHDPRWDILKENH
jgi:uncharacterized metal-binding protein YceD (DUF177 family)